MPWSPKRECREPGCRNRCEKGMSYCSEHTTKTEKLYEQLRGSATQRGYNAAWYRARGQFLARNPLCAECGRPATVVDHIVPHRGNKQLFWDTSNWQPLCEHCHDKKTASGR